MAGLGAKLFTAFSKLTAAQVNGYLMDQSIMRFASTAARDAAFGGAGEPTLAEGMTCYLDDTNQIQSYTGSAWVGVAASSTVADVSSGLVFIKQQSFSGTNFQVTSIFSANYINYRIFVNINTHAGGAANVTGRMLNATTPYTTAEYSWVGSEQGYAATAFTVFGLNNTAQWTLGRVDGDGGAASFVFDILNPFAARRTMFNNDYVYNTQNGQTGGILKNTTSFDGMDFSNGSTIAGTVTVYGYR